MAVPGDTAIHPSLYRYCMDSEFRERLRGMARLQMLQRFSSTSGTPLDAPHIHRVNPFSEEVLLSEDNSNSAGRPHYVRDILRDNASVGHMVGYEHNAFSAKSFEGHVAEMPENSALRNAHVELAKKYKCDLCHKSFSRSNTLVTHRRIHTGEKPFSCNLCGRAFRQVMTKPGNLTRHKLTHTSVKPFTCELCGKAFNRASNLHTHTRTHTHLSAHLNNRTQLDRTENWKRKIIYSV